MPDDVLPPTTPDDCFEEFSAKFPQAEERGERPTLSELLRTGPELESPFRDFFRNRNGFDRLARQLAPTATQPGVPTPPPGSRFGSGWRKKPARSRLEE